MIVIPTVQHTGSLFVVDHLFGGRQNVAFRHFGQPAFKQIYQYIDGRNIIVPLRKLKDIIISWAGRQSDPAHLENIRKELRKVKTALGEKGAAERAALVIKKFLGTKKK